jgi:hypothetical protein
MLVLHTDPPFVSAIQVVGPVPPQQRVAIVPDAGRDLFRRYRDEATMNRE